MEYEIESGGEVPQDVWRPSRRKYPFPDMEVGQSFFAAGATTKQINGSMQRWKRVLGRRFAIRKVDGGVRVWRIE